MNSFRVQLFCAINLVVITTWMPSMTFRLQTVLRIWDCLFYEGSKILFRVALTLIHHYRDLIEQAQSLPDICQIFKQITGGAFVEECHPFMQVRQDGVKRQQCQSHPLFFFFFFLPRKSLLSPGVYPLQRWLSSEQRVEHESSLRRPNEFGLLWKFHWKKDQTTCYGLTSMYCIDFILNIISVTT